MIFHTKSDCSDSATSSVTISKDNYYPIYPQLILVNYGDYTTLNTGAVSCTSGSATFSNAYIGNWSSATIIVIVRARILWVHYI